LSDGQTRQESGPITGTTDHLDHPAPPKLLPPPVPEGFLARARIASLLDEGAHKPLTRPRGAGRRGQERGELLDRHRAAPVAWLSLDEPDSDRRGFWSLTLAALRRAGGADALAGLQVHPGESVDILLPELTSVLEKFDQPITLVLDDLHRSSAPEIYADLELLLRHPSSKLRLVVSTCVDPPIGVQRLRLSGHVVEPRARDLAFTLDETELAAELTGRPDSWPLLDELTHRHAFLAPVGDRRGVYRLHTLFAELLRAQLKYERPAEVGSLHERAARWYGRNAAPVAALRHAVVSGNEEIAAELARACWVQVLATGELSVLRSLVEHVRPERVERDPEFALAFAASLIEGEHDQQVEHYLRVADGLVAGLPAERRRQFAVARDAVMLYRGRSRGDLTMAQGAAERLLSDVSGAQALGQRQAIRALAFSTLGIVELWNGELDRGTRHLERGLAIAGDAELDWVRLLCHAYLALGSGLAGRLAACERRAHAALDLAARRGWTRSTPAGVALTVLGGVQFHWNPIDEADLTLDRAAIAIGRSCEAPLLALCGLNRGRVSAAQGRPGESLEAFEAGLDKLSGWTAAARIRSSVRSSWPSPADFARASWYRARRCGRFSAASCGLALGTERLSRTCCWRSTTAPRTRPDGRCSPSS
jgi:ATP/maltotriose-dependent transcriptional regulator MalT